MFYPNPQKFWLTFLGKWPTISLRILFYSKKLYQAFLLHFIFVKKQFLFAKMCSMYCMTNQTPWRVWAFALFVSWQVSLILCVDVHTHVNTHTPTEDIRRHQTPGSETKNTYYSLKKQYLNIIWALIIQLQCSPLTHGYICYLKLPWLGS